MLRIVTFLAAAGFAGSLATAPAAPIASRATITVAGPTTVILVRHAEKADTSRDTPLSTAGEDRAMALAEALGNSGVTAIYATQYRRTQQTVKPLSQRVGVPVTVFDGTGAEYGKQYVAEILGKHRGETVVVAGHSNTVPLILRALGAEDVKPIADSEYDNLYVAILPEQGKLQLIRAHYGAR